MDRMKGKPFVLLGVNGDRTREKAKATVAQEKINWSSWWAGSLSESVFRAWPVEALPTMFLIDHKGVIRHYHLGAPPLDQLDKEIESLVREAAITS